MFTQQILYTVHLLGWVPWSICNCKFTAEYQLILNSNPSVIVKHFITLKSTCSLQHTQYENWIYCIYILDPWGLRVTAVRSDMIILAWEIYSGKIITYIYYLIWPKWCLQQKPPGNLWLIDGIWFSFCKNIYKMR